MAGNFTHAKVIYTPHGFSYLSFHGIKRILFYSLETLAKRWTDTLLAVSHSEAHRAIYELGFNNEKVETILNAIKIEDYLTFRNYKSEFRVNMVCRLTDQKNPYLFLDIAIAMLKKNPSLQFSILGARDCDNLTKEITAFLINNNLDKTIKILPWGNNETCMQFLNDTDIFVMTSIFEGLPFSLLEAMSLGIPCVVSKADGNIDVIQNNENGFSCITADEFIQKISMLSTKEGLRRQLGMAGYRYVKELHNIQQKTVLLQELYTRLCQGNTLIKIKQISNCGQEAQPALKATGDVA